MDTNIILQAFFLALTSIAITKLFTGLVTKLEAGVETRKAKVVYNLPISRVISIILCITMIASYSI